MNQAQYVDISRQNDLKYFGVFLYIGFCASAFMIPDSVLFGESLCFAYTYAMVQVLGVARFTGGRYWFIVAVTFATIVPTLQILRGVQNLLTVAADNVCRQLYMGRELLFYLRERNPPKTICVEKLHRDIYVSLFVFIWLLIDTLFRVFEPNALYKTTPEKMLSILHLSPPFWMALLSM